jgi:hypothetical protein
VYDLIRVGFGMAILWFQKDWFGLNAILSNGSLLVASYLVLSLIMTLYLRYFEPGESVSNNAHASGIRA